MAFSAGVHSHCDYGDDGDLASDYCPSAMVPASVAAVAVSDGDGHDDGDEHSLGTVVNQTAVEFQPSCRDPSCRADDDGDGDGEDRAEDGCHCLHPPCGHGAGSELPDCLPLFRPVLDGSVPVVYCVVEVDHQQYPSYLRHGNCCCPASGQGILH